MQVSKCGSYILSWATDPTIKLWCLKTMKGLQTFEIVGRAPQPDSTMTVGFGVKSALILDDKYVFRVCNDCHLYIWEISDPMWIKKVNLHSKRIVTLSKTDDGRIYTCDTDGIVRIHGVEILQ